MAAVIAVAAFVNAVEALKVSADVGAIPKPADPSKVAPFNQPVMAPPWET